MISLYIRKVLLKNTEKELKSNANTYEIRVQNFKIDINLTAFFDKNMKLFTFFQPTYFIHISFSNSHENQASHKRAYILK